MNNGEGQIKQSKYTPRTAFKKGDPRINRTGRPLGAKNRSWNSLQWWHDLIVDNMDEIAPEAKIELGKWGLQTLINKLPTIPASPQDSLERVNATVSPDEEIRQAEENANTKPRSDKQGMGTSQA